MLGLGLGLGLSKSGAVAVYTDVFDSTGLLLSATYSRNDALSMYRDSDGVWQNAAANTIIEDHDANGDYLGVRMWLPVTNKCTNYNWNPTDLTNLTVTGSSVGLVTIENHPVDGRPCIRINNSGGGGTKFANIGGTFANTNPHSMQVQYYVAAGTGANAFLNDSSGAMSSVTGDSNHTSGESGEIKIENFTPTNSARTMRISVSNGGDIYFRLNQLEEQTVCSPPIKVAGASATSAADYGYVLTSNIPNYNASQGCIVAEIIQGRIAATADQYAFVLNASGSSAETIGMYFESSSKGQARGRVAISSANKTNNDVHMPIRNKRFPVAISWRDSEALTMAGAMSYEPNETAFTGLPTGLNRLYFGSRANSASDGFCGWIKSLKVYNRYRTLSQIAPDMFPAGATYKGIVSAGQSNARGLHRSTETKENAGEIAAVSVMDGIWTTSENWLLNTGVDGSAVSRDNNATLYWVDPADESDGPMMTKFKAICSAFGVANIEAIMWDQGASDASDTYQNFYDNTLLDFTKIRAHVGDVPIIIRPIASRVDASYVNYNMVKRVHEDLANDLAYVHLAPSQNDITFGSDNIHPSGASYSVLGTIATRKTLSVLGETVTGAVDSPEILTATRVGTALTLPVTFPSGMTALTPTSSIYGIRYFDNGSEIALSSVAYSAGNITATLASLPVGTAPQQEVYVGYGSLFITSSDAGYTGTPATDTATTITNLLNYPVGNDTYTLGLQNTVITPS